MNASPLSNLRSELARLRRARAGVRSGAAWSAAGIAILLALAALFALDFGFRREVRNNQRVVLMGAAAIAAIWAFRKYAWPLLTVREDEIDMALLVERRQNLESDLTAALQFSGDRDGKCGSKQLQGAVISYVADIGRDLDVFQGFDASLFRRRFAWLFAIAVAIGIPAALFQGHTRAFLNRLALKDVHYPTASRFGGIAVNGRSVWHGSSGRPHDIRCAEGREIEFLVRCEGTIPSIAEARLASLVVNQKNDLELHPLDETARRARLEHALLMLKEAEESPLVETAGPWFEELSAHVRFEFPELWTEFGIDESLGSREIGDYVRQNVARMRNSLATAVESWKPDAASLFVGTLPRLNEPVRYRFTLGDAFTDAAEISMIPLPAVEAKLAVEPPKYAAKFQSPETLGRQMSALVGSQVRLGIECVNRKPLKEAWLSLRTASGELIRYPLAAADASRTRFELAAADSPLKKLEEEVRYEIQVTDDDGLHLESPIKGAIRVRMDKPPIAAASTLHRVVLPAARPSIVYRAGDDFGLKRLVFEVAVERNAADRGRLGKEPVVESSEEAATSEMFEVDVLPGSGIVTAEKLPLSGKFPLALAKLPLPAGSKPLQKGDRLHVTLVAYDDRGEAAGETFRAEPLVIDVSDELGVAAAVGESDPLAEQRVSEIIQRQLGIGESP